MHLKCKDWRRCRRERQLQSARMAKLWQFRQGHPKPAFSENVQRGDQGKFVKNRPQSSPRLKDPKALWRKWHYSLVSMHLKCKDWQRVWRKQRLSKCPNGQVMAILARLPKTCIFWKSAKGGRREILKKIAQKVALVEKAQNQSGANVIIL